MSNIEALFDTFNAKHKSDSEVASTFVEPPRLLDQLISRNHVILSGPRGSGKTTLLKMLTTPALATWSGNGSEELKSRVDFVSVFVPADRSWHGQLQQIGSENNRDFDLVQLLGLATFTTHIFKAITNAFLDWQTNTSQADVIISKLVPKLTFDEEQEVVRELSDFWGLTPKAMTFYELKESLAHRLSIIGTLKNKLRYSPERAKIDNHDFLYLDYREGIKAAQQLHNQASSLPSRRWLFLFDELEVAPSNIQDALIQDLRGTFDQGNINYRLAIAPYNRHFLSSASESTPSPQNDYRHIDLTFARKERGLTFTRQLCNSVLKQSGIDTDIDKVLGGSPFSFDDDPSIGSEESARKYSGKTSIGKVFRSLKEKDSSFAAYLAKRNVDLEKVDDLDEIRMASTLRKIRNIVIIRDYFSKRSKSGLAAEKLSNRSRKTFRLYTGVPTILALTEGNPRALINLITPIIYEFKAENNAKTVSPSRQAVEIEKSIRIMRSLLRAIPSREKRSDGAAITKLLDEIGLAFYNGVVDPRFSEQPPLSFRVDHGHAPYVFDALGKALNMGALVHVPDQGSEQIISSIAGKRFRLNYLLAAHYKLPISLDREIALSNLLTRARASTQENLEFPDEN